MLKRLMVEARNGHSCMDIFRSIYTKKHTRPEADNPLATATYNLKRETDALLQSFGHDEVVDAKGTKLDSTTRMTTPLREIQIDDEAYKARVVQEIQPAGDYMMRRVGYSVRISNNGHEQTLMMIDGIAKDSQGQPLNLESVRQGIELVGKLTSVLERK